jgi:hypothetical protein
MIFARASRSNLRSPFPLRQSPLRRPSQPSILADFETKDLVESGGLFSPWAYEDGLDAEDLHPAHRS